ncbi:MAG TPA: four helix bundle protein [Blastocatellia bacterium]|nr:four helix bundle protein [Blastocatellia bacterium]
MKGSYEEKPVNNARSDIRERTFGFAVRIVRLSTYLHTRAGASKTLATQVLRAATSVGANIEEAQAGQSRADSISKNAIALKEARETHYWLRRLVASRVVPESRIRDLRDEASQLMRIIGAIIVSSKKTAQLSR